jgi:hypothetical protein
MALRYACDDFYQHESIEARIAALHEVMTLLSPDGNPAPQPAVSARTKKPSDGKPTRSADCKTSRAEEPADDELDDTE